MHFGCAIILAGAALGAAQGAVSNGAFIGNNVPKFTAIAKNVGATNAATVIDVAVWLNLHNRAAFDALAAELYNPASSQYHHWIKPAQFAAEYAPTAKEAATVEQFLSSKSLSVVEVGPKNMYVRARGTVAAVNKAFSVKLDNFELNGKTYYANTSAPFIEGPAAALTASVYGLHNLQYTHPNLKQQIIPKSPSGRGFSSLATSTGPAPFVAAPKISSTCFTGVETETFNTNGSFPIATYTGNGYSHNSLDFCGYTPAEIHTAYNLSALYKAGFDGTGQTIVIIDWCGSPTITEDANTFSAAYGLPPLTSANFRIINSGATPTCGGEDPEINLDVEWAHAIAPGANIDLVVPPSATFVDVDSAEFFAVINGLGNVISNSYGSEEYYTPASQLETANLINEIAAVQGISANFSSGDGGDDTFGSPQYNPASVSAPADSPYATAIGGVSLALNSNNTIAWQTGWGNNATQLTEAGFPFDPPFNFGFQGGSGGGPSAVFDKPAYQSKLKGTSRELPDISWLADPYTGAVIVISVPFIAEPTYQVYGGTSLSCPMFSALWAIANQEAGVPLGQAAPYLYSMPAGPITDVLPITSKTNVTGKINQGGGVIDYYTAPALAAPLESTTDFYSAIWNYPASGGYGYVYVLTFNTDSGLLTTKGWDNVTGLGTPNGKAFADFFNPAK